MNFRNLLNPQNVESGIGEILFLAPISFFSSLKKPTPPFLFPGAEVIISDTHEFNAGACFIQLQLATGQNNITTKSIGDIGFQKMTQDIVCLIPGSYAGQHEFMKNILNVPLIALVKDSNCTSGFLYQVGTDCAPAYLSSDFKTGTTKDGNKSYLATISASAADVQLYTGNLLLQPGGDGPVLVQTEDGDFVIGTEGGDVIDWRI